jgi:hypothetical protein
MKIRLRNIREFILIWPVSFLLINIFYGEANVDSIVRTKEAQYTTFDNIAVLFSEPAVLIIASWLNDPALLQITLAILIAIICAFRYGYSSLCIVIFIFTPPGYILILNTQPFFIGAILAMSVTEKIFNQTKLSSTDWFVAIMAVLFHWAAFIVFFLEGIMYLLTTRSFHKIYKILLILFGFGLMYIAFSLGLFFYINIKLEAYGGVTTGVASHVYLSVLFFAIIVIINPFIKVAGAPAPRAFIYSLLAMGFMLIGSVKLGSRIAFFSDIVFYFWATSVFTHVLQHFLKTKKNVKNVL